LAPLHLKTAIQATSGRPFDDDAVSTRTGTRTALKDKDPPPALRSVCLWRHRVNSCLKEAPCQLIACLRGISTGHRQAPFDTKSPGAHSTTTQTLKAGPGDIVHRACRFGALALDIIPSPSFSGVIFLLRAHGSGRKRGAQRREQLGPPACEEPRSKRPMHVMPPRWSWKSPDDCILPGNMRVPRPSDAMPSFQFACLAQPNSISKLRLCHDHRDHRFLAKRPSTLNLRTPIRHNEDGHGF
jgi:hypothetical protein